MKVYLDMCSIQRPLDSRDQVRVALEAEAILGILRICQAGRLEIIGSEVLHFELRNNPDPVRREYAEGVLKRATIFQPTSDQVELRAGRLRAAGLKPIDALHLASALEADADYFCTCDDRLVKRARSADTGRTRVLLPVELAAEVA